MRHIHPAKAGIAAGAVIGLWHFTWACLVATNAAKPLLDFVLGLHFIGLQYQLAPFAWGTGAALVGLTFAIGFVFGFVFAVIWNWLGVSSSVSDDPKPASSHAQA